MVPTDIPLRGRHHAGLVGSLGGRAPATGAIAQLLLRPLLGLPAHLGLNELPRDLIAEGSRYISQASANVTAQPSDDSPAESLKRMQDSTSIWVGSSLGRNPGDQFQLLINDRTLFCTVRGVYPDSNGNDSAILMDIAAAQKALNRFGRVDRILLKLPIGVDLIASQERIQSVLPSGVDVHPQGTATNENRKMLAAFRWNLRLLSYIALVVGAFLIYNTISISVVRRRHEIGVVRALGESRSAILGAFLGEASFLGLAGALIALPLSRLMAAGVAPEQVGRLYRHLRPLEAGHFDAAIGSLGIRGPGWPRSSVSASGRG